MTRLRNGLNLLERDQYLLCKYLTYYELVANRDLNMMPYKSSRRKRCDITIGENYWDIIDGLPVLFMQCVICREYKPRLCKYYTIDFHKMDFHKIHFHKFL